MLCIAPLCYTVQLHTGRRLYAMCLVRARVHKPSSFQQFPPCHWRTEGTLTDLSRAPSRDCTNHSLALCPQLQTSPPGSLHTTQRPSQRSGRQCTARTAPWMRQEQSQRHKLHTALHPLTHVPGCTQCRHRASHLASCRPDSARRGLIQYWRMRHRRFHTARTRHAKGLGQCQVRTPRICPHSKLHPQGTQYSRRHQG
jgi:hypothetical protein